MRTGHPDRPGRQTVRQKMTSLAERTSGANIGARHRGQIHDMLMLSGAADSRAESHVSKTAQPERTCARKPQTSRVEV